jgi:hypothetical protein
MKTTSYLVCISLAAVILPACAQTDAELADRATIHVFAHTPGLDTVPSLRLDSKHKSLANNPALNREFDDRFGARTPDPLRAGPKIDIHF